MKKIFTVLLFFLFLSGCTFINEKNNNEIIISFVTYEGNKLESVKKEKITELPTPNREGYSFEGWFKDQEYAIPAQLDTITENLTLFAKWSKNEYTIIFKDYDGFSIQEQTLYYNDEITPPENPVREGYSFIGWDKEFDVVVEDMEIIAVYGPIVYEVTFIDNGIIIKTETVEQGKSATPPSDPTYAGKVFKGWDISYDNVRSNLTITSEYSDWVITFNTDGGGNIEPIYGNNGDNYSLPTPSKTNYTFLRWTYNNYEIVDSGIYNFENRIEVKAVWLANYFSSGNLVKYRNTQTPVLMPTNYTAKDKEFRGVWVSNLTSDITRYSTKEQMMSQLTAILDNMEAWNMNAIVYHIRIMNDALYSSQYNPISTYVSNANFAQWDYLEWFIGECHKRGIEFHAWLNPYRISNSMTLNQVLAKYANYPANPASKAENIIMGSSGTTSILNPGEPLVRQFLVDTVMEVIEKYDVDAIHFDDYFYISMSNDADSITYNKYKQYSKTTTIEDWRREQVDIFIRDLSQTMRAYNVANNRSVELGISPSGIYRNGNGKVTYDSNGTAITNGSNTAGMEHYRGYLYSDTKKWIDEEWIDYICPQSYWGFTHPVAGYADVVDWWVKVVKYKNVKLYTGMGIYMAQYSWKNNPKEASDQVLYNSKYQEIQGVCIFRYGYFMSKLNTQGVQIILNEYWTNKVEIPN